MTYISIALGLVCLGVSSTPMGSQYDSLRGAPGAVDQLLMLAIEERQRYIILCKVVSL